LLVSLGTKCVAPWRARARAPGAHRSEQAAMTQPAGRPAGRVGRALPPACPRPAGRVAASGGATARAHSKIAAATRLAWPRARRPGARAPMLPPSSFASSRGCAVQLGGRGRSARAPPLSGEPPQGWRPMGGACLGTEQGCGQRAGGAAARGSGCHRGPAAAAAARGGRRVAHAAATDLAAGAVAAPLAGPVPSSVAQIEATTSAGQVVVKGRLSVRKVRSTE
jgi:hypothetical protein